MKTDLEDCCAYPRKCAEWQTVRSASPYITPERRVRIVCKNCGRKTYWCNDMETAEKCWNGVYGGGVDEEHT